MMKLYKSTSDSFFFILDTYRTRADKGRGFYSIIVFSVLHNGSFHQTSSIFTIRICTNFSKMHLFLIIFQMWLLFQSVLYWRGYSIKSLRILFYLVREVLCLCLKLSDFNNYHFHNSIRVNTKLIMKGKKVQRQSQPSF